MSHHFLENLYIRERISKSVADFEAVLSQLRWRKLYYRQNFSCFYPGSFLEILILYLRCSHLLNFPSMFKMIIKVSNFLFWSDLIWSHHNTHINVLLVLVDFLGSWAWTGAFHAIALGLLIDAISSRMKRPAMQSKIIVVSSLIIFVIGVGLVKGSQSITLFFTGGNCFFFQRERFLYF